ncbi:SDR family NAD(P)-dependent oxidoreductase [Olivibacter domesticus]|uniref:NAD(P)-dependent dehydrogenase, short-chain alcohol dehydrogenase family n=1 Tax=Olivibacter domesticus TaxID=407022 RepID=A0A1H7KML0_OLID1|nr:SDR family NAD(P)-dependent oxidoreductase [Olivibacter domesticus]SEK88103.1 NAD(P)-dependent dehydrogenase, short-chain alcohol dehydrogenase family [Olivibacter domesticus]
MPTILITGGHSGLGSECSKLLASTYHYNLILAGRSPAKMETFAAELRNSYEVKVDIIEMDTSSLTSVRSGVTQCLSMLDRGEIESLQGIICNAGVRLNGATTYSEDGYETTFATNYLGHVLLTELLIDRVASKGRIVFTSSGTHDPETVDGKTMRVAAEYSAIELAHTGKNGKKPIPNGKAYSTSKLCIILYAYELNRRLKKAGVMVSSIAFDPGATFDTGFLRSMPKLVQWLASTSFMRWVMKRSGITLGDVVLSGQFLAKIAADPMYSHGSGKYFQSNNGNLIERRSSKLSYDEQRAKKLWSDTKTLVHLQENETSSILP